MIKFFFKKKIVIILPLVCEAINHHHLETADIRHERTIRKLQPALTAWLLQNWRSRLVNSSLILFQICLENILDWFWPDTLVVGTCKIWLGIVKQIERSVRWFLEGCDESEAQTLVNSSFLEGRNNDQINLEYVARQLKKDIISPAAILHHPVLPVQGSLWSNPSQYSGLYEHVVAVVHNLPPQTLMRVSPVLQPVFIFHLIIETVHQTITITRCVSPRLDKVEILQSLLDEKLSLAQRQKLRLLRCSWPRQVVEQEIFSFWSRTGLTLTIYSLSEILMAEYRSDTYCWLRRWVKSELTDYGQCRIICWQQPNVVVLFGLGDENHKVRLDQSNRSFT